MLNLTRYPHDQGTAYNDLRGHLKANGAATHIGGVALVTMGFPSPRGEEGSSSPRLRLIPLPNSALAPRDRLRETDFNKNTGDETIFSETQVAWDIEQVHRGPPEPVYIKDGAVWIGSTRLGDLPFAVGDGYAVTAARKPVTVRLA